MFIVSPECTVTLNGIVEINDFYFALLFKISLSHYVMVEIKQFYCKNLLKQSKKHFVHCA
jgi:hypothetical protein